MPLCTFGDRNQPIVAKVIANMSYLTPEWLSTDRLLLRTFQERDWKDLHKYYSDSVDCWGQGHASEAVRAIKKTWTEYLPELSLISLIHPNNTNSKNLAEAVGAHFEKDYEFRGDRVCR
jgi:RimJ/RimL family protein N-acetyltransferase